jgi:hypothetical protein
MTLTDLPSLEQVSLDTIGRSFNILELDPLNLAAGIKDASPFMLNRSIAPTPSHLDAGDYVRFNPDTPLYQPLKRVIYSDFEYQDAFKNKITACAADPLARFAFSGQSEPATYKPVDETPARITLYAEAVEEVGTLELVYDRPHLHPVLNEEFAEDVRALGTHFSHNDDRFLKFIDKYGTHFNRRAVLGGVMAFTSEVPAEALAAFLVRCSCIEEEVADIFSLLKAGDRVNTRVPEHARRLLREAVAGGEWHTTGGEAGQSYLKWRATVADQPALIRVELVPLSTLMTEVYFPEIPDEIEAIHKQFEAAIYRYAQRCGYKPDYIRPEVFFTLRWGEIVTLQAPAEDPDGKFLGLEMTRPENADELLREPVQAMDDPAHEGTHWRMLPVRADLDPYTSGPNRHNDFHGDMIYSGDEVMFTLSNFAALTSDLRKEDNVLAQLGGELYAVTDTRWKVLRMCHLGDEHPPKDRPLLDGDLVIIQNMATGGILHLCGAGVNSQGELPSNGHTVAGCELWRLARRKGWTGEE